jgi:gluconate 5-dehydrogenase
MAHPFSLEGKRILVTGGGQGIGLAIARSIVDAGGFAVLSGRHEETLAAACSELGERSSRFVGDVADLPSIPAFVAKVEEKGPLWGLVNNAGRNLKKDVVDTSDEEFLAVLQINLLGAFAMTREVGKRLLARGEGSVLFVASMTSLFGIPKVCAYTASKAAVAGLAKQIATEFSPKGVTVNAVAPGFIDTAMSRKAFEGDPNRRAKVISRTPMDRLGTPEEVGMAAAFLLSPAARYLTGVVLPVDGGTSIGF